MAGADIDDSHHLDGHQRDYIAARFRLLWIDANYCFGDMMINKLSFPIVLTAVLFAFGCGYAGDVSAVFATGEWPPYTSRQLAGYGYATEIVSAACKVAGIKPVYRFYPWPRAEKMAYEGEVFAAFPYIVTAAKKKKYYVSDILFQGINYFVYYDKNPRTPQPVQYETLDDLQEYRIGVIRGDSFEQELKNAGLAVKPSNLADSCIKMLALGRIDFYLGERVSISDMIKRLFPDEVDNFKFLPKVYGDKRPNALLVSRKYRGAEDILKKFNQGLRTIKKNGEYDRIRKRYNIPE